MLAVSLVDHVDQGCQRRGLSGTGCSGNENQSSLSLAQLLYGCRKSELSRRRNLEGQESHDHREGSALLEYVYAETSAAVKRMREVDLTGLLHRLDQSVVVSEERHNQLFDLLGRELLAVQRSQVTVDTEDNGAARRDMNIRRVPVDCFLKDLIQFSHMM